MYRIIAADKQEYGPVSFDQIRQWINEGRINSQTKVQSEGSLEWKLVGELPDFSDLLRGSVAVPPVIPPTPPVQSKTSGLAVASLALGIMGVLTLGVTAPIGVILGIVSLVRINRSNGSLRGTGLALAGTLVSGAFLLALPILAALLLPALAQAKARAQTIACINNMKQLALGTIMYANDHKGQFPSGSNWCDLVGTYVANPRTFQCPAGNPNDRCHYALNASLSGAEMKSVTVPAQTVLLFEFDGGWNMSGGSELVLKRQRHRRAVGLVFADGHSGIAMESRLQTVRWDP